MWDIQIYYVNYSAYVVYNLLLLKRHHFVRIVRGIHYNKFTSKLFIYLCKLFMRHTMCIWKANESSKPSLVDMGIIRSIYEYYLIGNKIRFLEAENTRVKRKIYSTVLKLRELSLFYIRKDQKHFIEQKSLIDAHLAVRARARSQQLNSGHGTVCPPYSFVIVRRWSKTHR